MPFADLLSYLFLVGTGLGRGIVKLAFGLLLILLAAGIAAS